MYVSTFKSRKAGEKARPLSAMNLNPLRPKGHICPALFECNFQCLFLIYVNMLHVFHRDKTFKYP